LIDLVIDYGQDAAHWTSFGEQAFSFAVPGLWNTLPVYLFLVLSFVVL